MRPLAVGSFGMDVVAPKRDRAREGLRKLDLVMLAVTINVNDSPFTAFGQDAALALDGMLESHDAEFRNLECIVHYSANPLLADFIGRGETKSMGEPAGRSIGAHAFHAVHRPLAEQRALPAAKTVERHRNWDGRARPSPRCHERIPNLPGPASRLVFKNQAGGCAVDKQAPLAVCDPPLRSTNPTAPAGHHTSRLDRACLRRDRPDE